MNGQLEVEQRTIRAPGVTGLYSEHPTPAALAYRNGLAYEEIEALIYEAETYLGSEPLEDGRMIFFDAKEYERMDRHRIETLKRHILNDKPRWVREIKNVMRHEKVIYWIVNLSGVPPYPGVAIVEKLIEIGDAPEDAPP